MTDNIDYRKGRNLAALSFVIIVYVLAGAEVTGQGVAGGFFLKIEHPHFIEFAAIALLTFSGYQFAVHVTQPNHRTLQHLYRYLCGDKKLQRHVHERAQSLLDDADTPEKIKELVSAKRLPELRSNLQGVWSPPELRAGASSRKRPTKIRSWNHVTTTAKAEHGERKEKVGFFEVKINPLFYYKRELLALGRAVYKHEEAWNDIFPIVLYVTAWILIVYNAATS